MSDDPNVHVRTEGARSPEALALIIADAKAGECPFCTEREQSKAIPTLFTEHWWAKHCEPPYPGTGQHVLLLTKQHFDTRQPDYLPADVLADRVNIVELAKAQLGMSTGVIVERFGDGRLTAQTVYHPTIHLFVSDGLAVTPDMLPDGTDKLMSAVLNSDTIRCLRDMYPDINDDDLEEQVGKLRDIIENWRAMQVGRAWPIRLRCSNAVVKR